MKVWAQCHWFKTNGIRLFYFTVLEVSQIRFGTHISAAEKEFCREKLDLGGRGGERIKKEGASKGMSCSLTLLHFGRGTLTGYGCKVFFHFGKFSESSVHSVLWGLHMLWTYVPHIQEDMLLPRPLLAGSVASQTLCFSPSCWKSRNTVPQGPVYDVLFPPKPLELLLSMTYWRGS